MDRQKVIDLLVKKIGELYESTENLVNKALYAQIKINRLEKMKPIKVILKPSEEEFILKDKVIDLLIDKHEKSLNDSEKDCLQVLIKEVKEL